MTEAIHITRNIKVAAALATLGAEPLSIDKVRGEGKDELTFTFAEQAIGITCGLAVRLWNNKEKVSLESTVDAIIAERGITPEEYALIQLEAARACLGNRGVMLKCGMQKLPMVTKSLKSGRQISYREGTPDDELRKALNS